MLFDFFPLVIGIQNMKPNDVTLEKALELLSGNDVRRCGRPKGKPRVDEVEAIDAF